MVETMHSYQYCGIKTCSTITRVEQTAYFRKAGHANGHILKNSGQFED